MNIEYKNERGEFPIFAKCIQGKKIAIMYDVNTKPFALAIKSKIEQVAKSVIDVYFLDEELVPDENACKKALEGAKKTDYLLAVGSGTLNDIAKYVTTIAKTECGVLATAASMDGYLSKGAAVMQKGFKITETVHTPSDVLIDLDIVCHAPKLMTAAGFGDIVGKFTCLTDWKLANLVLGEQIDQEAYALMEKARSQCMDTFEELTKYTPSAVEKLMNALLAAGLSMAACGNSRPASGSEHHISHFLEMDFVRRGEKIPPHGIKVAIGTLVSIELYNYLKENNVRFTNADAVYKIVDELPKVEEIKEKLEKMGCPTRFSQIGVREETMRETIKKAYTVRERFTVLTLIAKLGLTEQIEDLVMKKYY